MQMSAALRVAAPFARPHRRRFGLAALLVLAETGLVLLRPWPLALAVDHALDAAPPEAAGAAGQEDLGPMAVLALAAVASLLLTAALGLLRLGSQRLAEGSAERVGHSLRSAVFERAMTRSLRWHDHFRSGELLTRVTTDVGRLLDALVAVTTTLLPDVLLLVGVLALIATIEPGLALVGLSVVPILVWLTLDQRGRVRAAELSSRDAAGQLAATAQDLIRNVRAVQAFGRQDLARATFDTVSRAQQDADVTAVRVASRWSPLADGVLAVGAALVLVVGGSHVLDGDLTIGALLVVIAYLRDLYAPVRSLTRLSGLLAKAEVSAGRIATVLGAEETAVRAGELPAPAFHDRLAIEDVTFGYRRGRPVLRDVSLRVGAGETVCLIGASGAGKSTLLHLLLRLYDVDAGRITIDGVDVQECTVASVRDRFAFLPQDPWLLDDTLAANVALGRRGASRREVEAACALAQVDEFVDTLPLGLDSRLGEGALRLSGGERRRVALARAVVTPAPMLLLDEPTASLDDDNARRLVAAIAAVTADRSALIVTHDLRLAEIADRVVALDSVRGLRPSADDVRTDRAREEVAP